MKITLILLLTATSLVFNSCDSASPLIVASDESEVATALPVPADGDTILFTNTLAGVDPLLTSIVLSGPLTNFSNSSFLYRQVTNQRFDIEALLRNGQNISLVLALDNVLGEPTTLSSRFRDLILRDTVDFTSSELQEIITTLNPSGASLIINPENPLQILGVTDRFYRFEVTSNVGDQIRGSMGGIYFAEENSIIVDFREPTNFELNRYRFLTIRHKIPFLTGQRTGIQVNERGTFVLDLVNRNNQPRL